MRVCVFSDLHGNIPMLNKMLDAEKDAQQFIFCGDAFGYTGSYHEVVREFLKIPNLLAVQGNNDNYLISYLSRSILLDEFAKEDKELNFLKNMPEYLETTIEGKSLGIFHGGPSNHFGQRIYEETVLDEKMISKYDYLLLGHTHERLLRKVGKTVIINPGSLGSPRDESGNSYCILDIETEKVEFKKVK